MPATKNAPTTTQPALDALIAQRKQLDDQIKAARQADRHVPKYVALTLLPHVQKRVNAGADADAALDAELAEVRAALVTALAAPAASAESGEE